MKLSKYYKGPAKSLQNLKTQMQEFKEVPIQCCSNIFSVGYYSRSEDYVREMLVKIYNQKIEGEKY